MNQRFLPVYLVFVNNNWLFLSRPIFRLFYSMPIINDREASWNEQRFSSCNMGDYADIFVWRACVRVHVHACAHRCTHGVGRVWESSQVTGLTNNARFRCAVVVDDFFTSHAHHAVRYGAGVSSYIFCVSVRHSRTCMRPHVCFE